MRPIRLPLLERVLGNTSKINELRNRRLILPHRQKAELQCPAFLSYPEITFFQFTWSTIFIKCFCTNVFQLILFVLLLAGDHFVVAGQMVKLFIWYNCQSLLLKKTASLVFTSINSILGSTFCPFLRKSSIKWRAFDFKAPKKPPQSKNLEFIFPFWTSIKKSYLVNP